MKRNFKFLLLIFVIILVSEVRGQSFQRDSTEVITEPIGVYPFAVKRKNVYVNLPIKLRGIGFGVIKLYLNNKGDILSMDIQKLKIHLKSGKNIDFYSTDSLPRYPNQVKKYYPYLRKYANSIKITPVPQINIPPKTCISLMVRFN